MTNILLKLSDLQIKKNQIIEEKDKYVQNLHEALKKEEKLKVEFQDKNNKNNQVLVEL